MSLSYLLTGDTINTGRQKINTNTDEIITGATNPSNGILQLNQYGGGNIQINYGYFQNGQIAGLNVFKSTSNPLHFTVSLGSYLLNGTQVNSTSQSVTLDNGHATLDRFDLLALDATGTLSVIKGTPSSVPATPSYDETDYYIRSIVYVRAGAGSGSTGGVVVYGGGGSTMSRPQQPSTTGSSYSYFRMGTDENSDSNWSVGIGPNHKINSDFSAAIAGEGNIIESGSSYSSIIGGKNNRIPKNLSGITIIGGQGITADTSNTVYVPTLSATTGMLSPNITADTLTITSAGATIKGQGSLIIYNQSGIMRAGGIGSGSNNCYLESSLGAGGSEYTKNIIANLEGYKLQNVVSGDSSTTAVDRNLALFLNSNGSTIQQDTKFATIVSDNSSTIRRSSEYSFVAGSNTSIVDSGNTSASIISSNQCTIKTGGTYNTIIGSTSSLTNFDTNYVNIIGANARVVTSQYPDYSLFTENLFVGGSFVCDGMTSFGSNITASTQFHIYAAETTAGALTLYLPANPVEGQRIIIKDGEGNAKTGNITIDGQGETIDGNRTYTISANWGFIEIIYNGNLGNWLIISSS